MSELSLLFDLPGLSRSWARAVECGFIQHVLAPHFLALWLEGHGLTVGDGDTRPELFEELFAAGDSNGQDRCTRTQRDHAQARVSLCHGMGFAARAFREDDDDVARFQLFVGCPQSLAVCLAAFDWKRPHETHQPA